MRRSFVVVMDVPANATVDICIEYIQDALSTFRGSLRYPYAIDINDPGDPMWHLNTKTIRVTPSKVIAQC